MLKRSGGRLKEEIAAAAKARLVSHRHRIIKHKIDSAENVFSGFHECRSRAILADVDECLGPVAFLHQRSYEEHGAAVPKRGLGLLLGTGRFSCLDNDGRQG